MIKYELFNNETNNDNENICSLQIQIQAKKIVVDFFIRTILYERGSNLPKN